VGQRNAAGDVDLLPTLPAVVATPQEGWPKPGPQSRCSGLLCTALFVVFSYVARSCSPVWRGRMEPTPSAR
jgi:hypothetical protein